MKKVIYFKIIFLVIILATALVSANVAFAQQNPTANAGPDLYLDSYQTYILQGSGYDPNGYALNYSWSCSGGTLSNPSIAQPVYTAPFIFGYDNRAIYTCALTVSNNYGASSSDSTKIYVNYDSINVGGITVQTNSAANISNYQATLNGYVANPIYQSASYVWFQWGTSANYGNETSRQSLARSGPFSQNIANLSANTTYHFRAVAQINNGSPVYGQDMTFYASGSDNYYGNLIVSKKVINLTSGNLAWQSSVSAKPSDLLSFVITIQADRTDAQNVFVRDTLPENLIYRGNLTVNANLNYLGNPLDGINVGTLRAGEVYVIAYQAQVAPAASFSYGLTTLSNSATITSSNAEDKTVSAQVLINNSIVSGATYVPTGAGNNPITDNFFLPVALIILGSWLYFSGRIYRFADWLKKRA